MILTIWSHFVDEEWQGEILAPDLRSTDEINNYIYEYFNRVDDADARRLESIGYKLPSLSVGDRITYQNRTFRVHTIGFQEIDPDEPKLDVLSESLRI